MEHQNKPEITEEVKVKRCLVDICVDAQFHDEEVVHTISKDPLAFVITKKALKSFLREKQLATLNRNYLKTPGTKIIANHVDNGIIIFALSKLSDGEKKALLAKTSAKLRSECVSTDDFKAPKAQPSRVAKQLSQLVDEYSACCNENSQFARFKQKATKLMELLRDEATFSSSSQTSASNTNMADTNNVVGSALSLNASESLSLKRSASSDLNKKHPNKKRRARASKKKNSSVETASSTQMTDQQSLSTSQRSLGATINDIASQTTHDGNSNTSNNNASRDSTTLAISNNAGDTTADEQDNNTNEDFNVDITDMVGIVTKPVNFDPNHDYVRDYIYETLPTKLRQQCCSSK